MSKKGREGTTRTTTRITQKNDLESIKNTKKKNMGVPLETAAKAAGGIPAGAITAATSIANLISQGAMNRKTRQWNEAMYQKQRTDALADWARTNEYNAPLQQMARLKEAGLSPHLIYGGGANSISQPVRSTDTKSWSPNAPQIDGGQIVSQYFGVQQQQNSLKIQEQQIQGLKLDNEYKEKSLGDRLNTPALTNERIKEQTTKFMNDIRLSKNQQDLFGPKYQLIEEQTANLIASREYQQVLSQNVQAETKIKGFMAEQIQLIIAGQISKNNITAIEAKWKQQIDDYVGAAGPLSSSLLKILITALTR